MKMTLFILTGISFLSLKSMACDGEPSCPMTSKNITQEKRSEIADCLKNPEKTMDECHQLMAGHSGASSDGKHSCSEHGKMKKEREEKEEKNTLQKK
jgi:hypothetical protein